MRERMALTFSRLFRFINLSHTLKTGLKEVVLNPDHTLESSEVFKTESTLRDFDLIGPKWDPGRIFLESPAPVSLRHSPG